MICPASLDGMQLLYVYISLFLQSRLVQKTALKLLLVFVEYTECNTLLLLEAIAITDNQTGNYIL